MKHTVEMASNGIIYKPGFIKISTGVQTLLGEYTHTDTDIQRQQADFNSLLSFFKNKKSRLTIVMEI
jgi:hypothetical protein